MSSFCVRYVLGDGDLSAPATDGEPITNHGRAIHEVDVELRNDEQFTGSQLVLCAYAPEEIAAPIELHAGTCLQEQTVDRHELEQGPDQKLGFIPEGNLGEPSGGHVPRRRYSA